MQLCFRLGVPEQATMAITIRNKQTEEGIRRLGHLHGEGPSAVVSRLVEKELRELASGPGAEKMARRKTAVREWLASLPPVTDDDRRKVDQAAADLYDENGLPR